MDVVVYKLESKHKERKVAWGPLLQMDKNYPLRVAGDYGITTTPVHKLFAPRLAQGDILAYTDNSCYRIVFAEVEKVDVITD